MGNGKKSVFSGKSVRTIMLINMAMCFLAIFVLLFFTVSFSMNGLVQEEENTFMRCKVDMERSVLESAVEYIPAVTQQWASLSSAYAYTTGAGEQFYRSTLVPDSSYNTNRLNVVAVLNAEDEVLFEKFYDYKQNQQMEHAAPMAALYSRFAAQCRQRYEAAMESERPGSFPMGFAGFVAEGDVVYYLSAYPVADFPNKRPQAGTLVIGRIINKNELSSRGQNEEGITLAAIGRSSALFGGGDIRTLDAQGFLLKTSARTATAYGVLTDAFGKPDILITVENDRDSYAKGQRLIQTVIVLVAAACAVALLLTVLALNRAVVGPVRRLVDDVQAIDIEKGSNRIEEIANSKELHALSKAINQMLVRIRQDRNLIQSKSDSLFFNANFDPLTRLHNRMSTDELLATAIAKAQGRAQTLSIFYFDVDRLKYVNNTWSHAVGNTLIQNIADRLRVVFSDGEILSRIGGDEFLVCVVGVGGAEACQTYADRVMRVFSAPFQINERRVDVSVSVGSATYPENGQDADTLIKCAEMAMYNAKALGRGQYVPYLEVLKEEYQRHSYIENKLRAAIYSEREEFSLHFQPKVVAKTGAILQCEALIRWFSPEGKIYPDEFIPQAEDSGLIIPLTWWVMEEACRFARTLQDAGWPTRVAINIPAQVIMHDEFLGRLQAAAQSAGVSPSMLEVEIIERTLLEDSKRVSAQFEGLQKLGVEISVDDFGTGYSSLSYLNRLSVDRIKIDRSFINEVSRSGDGRTIVRAIIAMAKNLDILITAEGVEDQTQYDFLLATDCDEIQGYLISRPLPAQAYLQFVQAWNTDRLLPPPGEDAPAPPK